MTEKANTLVEFLRSERVEDNLYRGNSRDLGTPQVYGGQVLGQAILAAQATVDHDRAVHSVHCYFLNRGDFTSPIVYEVDRSRDGGSFTARRVVAIQHGRAIFTMSASFQKSEPGLDHYRSIQMPRMPTAESNPDMTKTGNADQPIRKAPTNGFIIDRVPGEEKTDKESLQWWIKTREPLPPDQGIHCAALAYISDFGLLSCSLLPHGYPADDRTSPRPKILFASIDHAVWYHRPCKVDDWLLYYCRPISTSGARGIAEGSIYSPDGTLVATTIQEGLVRPLD